MSRPLTARRQPLTARPVPPGQDQTITAPDGTVIGAGPPPGYRPAALHAAPGTAEHRCAACRAARRRSANQYAEQWPRTARAGCRAPTPGAPARRARLRRAGLRRARLRRVPAQRGAAGEPEVTGHASTIGRLIGQIPGKRPGSGTETFSSSAGQLARDNVRETVAILLLGLGGLILPFPFWPLGAIVAMFSPDMGHQGQVARDCGATAGHTARVHDCRRVRRRLWQRHRGHFHAVHVSFGLLVRMGSVLTAAYLAWRVSKGPRSRLRPGSASGAEPAGPGRRAWEAGLPATGTGQ